ncbi:MAG: SIR2 family protein [Planctomycetota bacterium]|nr:SIR2 family protein [Planctomycetota bacterium]
MSAIYRDMDDVVEAVRYAKRRGKKCALLIGAGCSASAGVPLARGFVDVIKDSLPIVYDRAKEKTYPHCMAELADGERRDLIAGYVESARINWAHLGIAQLIKAGYLDRVLTTNFDPLVLRACALLNVFPAVYDFAASQRFKPAYTPEKAVFHLHGQHTGFVLLHTEEEVSELSKSIAPLFEDAGRGRLWLVVGYSGENDPVFEHLANVDRFDQRLYWVGYKDSDPERHVKERLLGETKSAFFVKGYDADGFFTVLGQRLGCFPPVFVEKPFSHLGEMLDTITSYTPPGQATPIDIRLTAKTLISAAIRSLEEGPERKTLLAEAYLLAAQFDAVLTLRSDEMSPSLTQAVGWALTMQGNSLFTQAKTKSGADADALFAQAGEKYAAALTIKPDFHEALNNWAVALIELSRTRGLSVSGDLLEQAWQKCMSAEHIAPGRGAYNLACICALRSDKPSCQHWLEMSRSQGSLPTPSHLLADADLEAVRNTDWFQNLLLQL